MQINTRRSDQMTILDVSGDIDLANSPTMRKALLHELKELRTARVILSTYRREIYRQLWSCVTG